MDLKKIISQGESEIVEFKKSLSESKEIIKTISAFTNTKGGRPPYRRVGKSTLLMSKDEYERSILEKHKDKLYFDSQICKEATLGDIDKEKIRWFLKEGKRQGRVNISIDAPRDYASPSKIQIRVFSDRIEVWNPGRLPSQLRIEDLKKPHPSIPYNPLIFR